MLTAEQLDAAEASIASRKGAITFAFADQTITFESAEKFQLWIDQQRAKLAAASGGLTKYVVTSKGV